LLAWDKFNAIDLEKLQAANTDRQQQEFERQQVLFDTWGGLKGIHVAQLTPTHRGQVSSALPH